MKKNTSVTRLVIAMVTLFTITKAFSAVECEKIDGLRGYRPKNELAKEIALKLKVSTCNGKRFQEVVKKLGETSNVPVSSTTYKTTEDVVNSIKNK